MKKSEISLLRVLFLAVAFTVFLVSPTMSAAITPVTLTGTVLPPGQKKGFNNYVLKVQGQERVFQITDAYVLNSGGSSGGGLSPWSILNLTPRQKITVFGGGEEAIRALTEPDVLCKGVRIHGTLHPSSGTLFLAEVERAPKEDEPEMCQ